MWRSVTLNTYLWLILLFNQKTRPLTENRQQSSWNLITLFWVYLWLPSIYLVTLFFHYDSDTESPFQIHLFQTWANCRGKMLRENEIDTSMGYGKNSNSGSFTNERRKFGKHRPSPVLPLYRWVKKLRGASTGRSRPGLGSNVCILPSAWDPQSCQIQLVLGLSQDQKLVSRSRAGWHLLIWLITDGQLQ